MDLATVLADGTDGLGHAALARYFQATFTSFPNDYPCAFRVRAAVNIGVQQLATRSRVDPAGECFLQVGGFSPEDLAAALVEAMPHTRVYWQQGESGPPVAAVAAALAVLRARLAADAMPMHIHLADCDLAQARFGLIALYVSQTAPDPVPWLSRLSPGGVLLLVHRERLTMPPRLSLHRPEAAA